MASSSSSFRILPERSSAYTLSTIMDLQYPTARCAPSFPRYTSPGWQKACPHPTIGHSWMWIAQYAVVYGRACLTVKMLVYGFRAAISSHFTRCRATALRFCLSFLVTIATPLLLRSASTLQRSRTGQTAASREHVVTSHAPHLCGTVCTETI